MIKKAKNLNKTEKFNFIYTYKKEDVLKVPFKSKITTTIYAVLIGVN